MLDWGQSRPKDISTIYVPDADLSKIENQLRSMSPIMESAFKNYGASITSQAPTETKMGGWILSLPWFRVTMEEMIQVARMIRDQMGVQFRWMDVNWEQQKVGLVLEEYEPSAFVKQVSYDVTQLDP